MKYIFLTMFFVVLAMGLSNEYAYSKPETGLDRSCTPQSKYELPSSEVKYIFLHGVGCAGIGWFDNSINEASDKLKTSKSSIFAYEFDKKIIDCSIKEREENNQPLPKSLLKAFKKSEKAFQWWDITDWKNIYSAYRFSNSINTILGKERCKTLYGRDLTRKEGIEVGPVDMLLLAYDPKTKEKVISDFKDTINFIQSRNADPKITIFAISGGSYVAYETLRTYSKSEIPHKKDITLVLLGSPIEGMAGWLENLGSVVQSPNFHLDTNLKHELSGLYSICGNDDVFCDYAKKRTFKKSRLLKSITSELPNSIASKGVEVINGSLYINNDYPKKVVHLIGNPKYQGLLEYDVYAYLDIVIRELQPRLMNDH